MHSGEGEEEGESSGFIKDRNMISFQELGSNICSHQIYLAWWQISQ